MLLQPLTGLVADVAMLFIDVEGMGLGQALVVSWVRISGNDAPASKSFSCGEGVMSHARV